MKTRGIVGLAAALAVAAHGSPARADFEWWNWVEYRLPVVRAGEGRLRTDLRIFTDVRLNGRSGGLAQSFLRAGPLFHVAPWMFIALHGTIYADRLANGSFDQEARAELEPNLHGRVGDFTFNDRNRLEYRWRAHDQRFRYRNQLRVNYAPPGALLMPFVWDEVLIDLAGEGFNQNRLNAGVGVRLNDFMRLDVSYHWRARTAPDGWAHDHGVILYLFVDVPPAPAPVAPPLPPPPASAEPAAPAAPPPGGAAPSGP